MPGTPATVAHRREPMSAMRVLISGDCSAWARLHVALQGLGHLEAAAQSVERADRRDS
jgi:hypothetical protein